MHEASQAAATGAGGTDGKSGRQTAPQDEEAVEADYEVVDEK
jgi:hypothetical protein